MSTEHVRVGRWISGGLMALTVGCVAPSAGDGAAAGASEGGKADGTADYASTYVGRLGDREDIKHAPLNESQAVEVRVVRASEVAGERGTLHVESTEVRFRLAEDEIVELGVGTDYPDTTVGFELAYRREGEGEDAFRVIEPPESATARGGYWMRVGLDPIFGRVTGTWRPGEGLEPLTVWGYGVYGADPNLETGRSVEALPRGEPLEFRVRVVPLWSPGELDGLSFEATVTTIETEPDHRVVRTDVLEEEGRFIARGYDDEDEIVIEARMSNIEGRAELIAEYLDGTNWREVGLVIEPDEDGSPEVVEQSGQIDGTLIALLYTLQHDLTRDSVAGRQVGADPVACLGAVFFCYLAAAIVTAPLEIINVFVPGAGAVAHGWATHIGAAACTAATCAAVVSPAWR